MGPPQAATATAPAPPPPPPDHPAPPRPRPQEQPRLPDSGPVHEVREHREPNELPPSEHRLTPHELKRTNGS
ncbi:DUF6479 family protein [Streptomyces sp. S1A1-3]|uniref:DUF6479 family protein n=1 Tax=Streptomyces sp. S1A1-3 TaxID=2594458 RepID=UPI0021B1200B|nr:DUF6479 family protein [Streptomyces sp. S1A1-3]